jgi:excinuclease ABC subunit A
MDNICPGCGRKFVEPDPRLFSFDSPIGACPECKGFGNTLKIDEAKLVPNSALSLLGGALDIFNKPSVRHVFHKMINFLIEMGVDVNKPFHKLTKEEKRYIYNGGGKGKKKFLGLDKIFIELEKKKYKVYIRVLLAKYKSSYICDVCKGKRLVAEALNYRVNGKTIVELHDMPISEFYQWLGALNLTKKESDIAKEILKQLFQRSSFVNEIGLSYLTMSRLAKTLSNGEAQRINLANQLGAALVDTIYVLDEPSIGLHPRDVNRLITMIYKIRDNGNRVIVVEHDPSIIKAMDYVLELGPESGERGGRLIYSGNIDDFSRNSNTITSRYLRTQNEDKKFHRRKIGPATSFLSVSGLKENNLRNLKAEIPLNRFVCVTGVSGSGKSSLVTKSLYSILAKHFEKEDVVESVHKDVEGLDYINDVMLIDQESIGRSQRSTPITFITGFDDIRGIFAGTPLAKSRGYTASHFSFNVESGQCSVCGGDGFISVDMQFMADIYMKCEVCGGTRYKREILDVTYKDKNISQVLGMTVQEAYDFFIAYHHLRDMFKLLIDVGLDYLVIGQAAATLSGGEAQRLKICKELLGDIKKKRKSRTFYIMDEPTTGLHPSEVDKLLVVIQKLVDEGSTVVVVEHNMDLVKYCDHVIDLGPDAGESGGRIVVEGTPEEVAANKNSYTGAFLRDLLEV